MTVLITTRKQKAKWAAVEGDQNASTTTQPVKQKANWAVVEGDQNASTKTQLVKQKAKWADIEDGDDNVFITTHIEKNRKQCWNHKATKSKNNTRITALEQSVE